VAGACAEYREISIRLERDEMDVAAAQQGLAWLQNNLGRFEEAARLDPELQGAADYIRWFNQMFQDPAALARISQAEFDQREEPLAKACTFGAGRA
jgi:hypothetical protein